MAGISYRDVHGIADELGVDVQTVRRWIQSGKLRAFKPGKEYRVREADLEEFLAAREVRPKASSPSSSEPSLFNGLEGERRLLDYRKCRQALDRFCDYWEQALERDQLDRRACDDFNTGARLTSTLLLELWSAERVELRVQRGEDPQTIDKSEPWPPGLMEKSELWPAIDRWMIIGLQLHKIAEERFGDDATPVDGVADLREYIQRKAG